MLAGIILAFFFRYNFEGAHIVLRPRDFLIAVVSLCLIASSNYVLNGIMDAASDRHHPVKKFRPIPSGQVSLETAAIEWILLGALGLSLALFLNRPYFFASAGLLVMGLIYNIPPLRSKDYPYVDVLSESVNNPLRLFLGWFIVLPHVLPPISLVVAYWMVGAFFMASKRFAEYRSIASPDIASAYRHSFHHYTEHRLLLSMFFYASATAFLLGIFITHFRPELIVTVPLLAGFFSYYLSITLKIDSTAQNPEKIYKERGLMWYLAICVVAFVVLLFVRVPIIGRIFNLTAPTTIQLWRL